MKLEELYNLYLKFPSIATDTRSLNKGDIFFALKGPNFNVNFFIEKALNSGASYCISDDDSNTENEKIIHVVDVLKTLQDLAKFHRQKLNIPFIAITGSNGKTTTKELVHEVLSQKFKTYTTYGNLNNHIGIPLTILKIKESAEIAVIEMGANHVGEIKSYCEIVQPTHGLITNCGSAHLEGFGSEVGVRKGKGELYEYLAKNRGVAFVNSGLDYLLEMSQNVENKIFYGSGTLLDASVKEKSIELKLKLIDLKEINTQLVGEYNLSNVLSAFAIGKYFKIPEENIIRAIENYSPSNNRSQLLNWKSNQVVLDAYNANPSSMEAAIRNFGKIESEGKALILGGMKELGAESNKLHINLINIIKKYNWKFVALVGEEFKTLMPEAKHFVDSDEAGIWLNNYQPKNLSILVKGSRGNKMEKVLDY